ncbi:hypothetical protein BKA70DRAFT_1279308 [Coprinopsis sp. MPI-PUGE-AT-0042]|nr:hypothetical protein BKA70DRAFT_1279308 [Coprinopsis sp. MPI-PUGE-AT-0042]
MDDDSPEPQTQTTTTRRKRPREDETATQRLKRVKAAERQRKKRERDRARAQSQAEAEQAENEAQFAAEQARIQAEEQEAEQRAAHTAAHAAAQAAVALLFPPPPPEIAEELMQHFVLLHQTHPHLVPVPGMVPYPPHLQPGVALVTQDPLQQAAGPALEIVHEDGVSGNPRPSTQFATDAAARAAQRQAEDANMTPEEIARRDKVRADARERQRRHRAAVKERRNQQLGLESPTEEPPDGPSGPVEFVHVNPGDPSPSGSNAYSYPPVPAGQTFASTLLLSFSGAPLLKAYILRTLDMTNDELASFEPIIAEAWEKWNAERQATREQNRDRAQPYPAYPDFDVVDDPPAMPPHLYSAIHNLPPPLPPSELPQYRLRAVDPGEVYAAGSPASTSTLASTSSQAQSVVAKQSSRRSRPQPQPTRRQARPLQERQPTEPLSPPRQQQQFPQDSPSLSPSQQQQHLHPPPPPTFAMSDGPDLSPSLPGAPPRISTPPATAVVVDALDFRNRISALAGGRLGFTRSFTTQSSTFRSPYDQATMNSSSSSIGSVALPPDASLFDSPPRPAGT